MRKLLVFLFILIFVFSLETQAKDAFSFEPAEARFYEGMDPFFTGYRESLPEDFSIVEGAKWWHGTHALQLTMTHPGNRWILLTKNSNLVGLPEGMDSTFLPGLNNRDTMYYYLYIPWSCPIDSIFIMVRNEDWGHDEHTIYHPRDLRFGRWNELKDGISDNFNGEPYQLGTDGDIIQSDFQIDLIAGSEPACTLYFDAISSKGRVPSKYCDTTGQAGIQMPEKGNGINVAKGSINCVEYAINASAPVIVQVFDLTGRKQLEIPVGMQPAGTYSIPLDLPAGVYLARVATITGEATGKAICVK